MSLLPLKYYAGVSKLTTYYLPFTTYLSLCTHPSPSTGERFGT